MTLIQTLTILKWLNRFLADNFFLDEMTLVNLKMVSIVKSGWADAYKLSKYHEFISWVAGDPQKLSCVAGNPQNK